MLRTTSEMMIAFVLAASMGSGTLGQEPAEAKPLATERVHRVQAGELVLRFEQEGRIDSASRAKARLVPQAYSGGYDIIEVVKRSGAVKKGDVLMRFDPQPYEEQLRGASESLDDARRRLEWARQEQQMQVEATAVSQERAQKTLEAAQRALQTWESHGGPKTLRSAELWLEQGQHNIDDQQEELDQLEAMYQGTHLAAETKDIVLKRARRSLRMAHAWYTLSQGDHKITTQVNYPIQDRDVRDEVRYAAQQLEHASVNAAIGLARKQMEVEGAERGVRDAEERLAKLEADRSTLALIAPIDGVLTAIALDAGDSISARQVVAEVLDPSRLVVRLNLKAEDLGVLEVDTPLILAAPEIPELMLTGRLSELAGIGAAAGEATHFPAVVALENGADRLRIGMRCSVVAEMAVADALTVPRQAITREHGRSWCTVRDAGGDVKRSVVVGPTSGDFVQIMSGLNAGEEVVIAEAPKP